MNPVRALELFLLKILLLGSLIGHYLPLVLPSTAPKILSAHPYRISIAVVAVTWIFYSVLIYPYYVSPLRHLPVSSTRERGQLMFESPRGLSALQWMRDNPDAQMIRIRSALGFRTIIPSGTDALRDILNTKSYDFEKPWGVRAFLGRAIGFGLIVSEGADHKKQRKALTPAFHIKRIRELYGLIWEKTQILLREMAKDVEKHRSGKDSFGTVEIGEWASKLTLDIIGPVAMGRDFQSLTSETNEIADNFLELLRPTPDRLAFFGMHFILPEYVIRRLPLQNNKTLERIGNFLRSVCRDIVSEKNQMLQRPDAKLSDFDILSRIIQTKQFTDEEIVDQMLTFLAAGHETTASALTWCCYLCAKYPEVQQKLRTEVHERIPSSSSQVTWDQLESMPYLNGVCEETQRLYPTVPATIREAIRDTIIAGQVIPKGVMFTLVPYAINRHPRYWGDNADSMIPERWIDNLPDGTQRPNKTGGTSTNFSELTFLHGPRSCIGQDFAKAELRCAVAGVVGKFHIELTTTVEPRVSGVITMKPESGMYLKFQPIEGW